MEVILLQDIRGLGKKNDIKNVSDGYAKNLLIPKGLVKMATPEAAKDIVKFKMELEEREKELLAKLGALARELKDVTLDFDVKTDAKGSVFGSVTKEMILEALQSKKILGTERVEVILEHPLKQLGVHKVKLDFKKGITTELKVELRGQK